MNIIGILLLAPLMVFAQEACLERLPPELNPLEVFNQFNKSHPKSQAIKINSDQLCIDFYGGTCSSIIPDDPTGSVIPLVKGLSKEQVILQNNLVCSLSNEWEATKLNIPSDEYVIHEYYQRNDFDRKLDKWDAVLNKVKVHALNFVKSKSISSDILEFVEAQLNNISISRVYTNRPEILFANTALVGSTMIIGGELLNTVTSENAIFFALAHETGHTLKDFISDEFKSSRDCLFKKFGNEQFVKKSNNIEEIWADWFGARVFAEYLSELNQSTYYNIEASKNAVRFFCGYGGSDRGHPPGDFRVRFFFSTPAIKKLTCPSSKQAIYKETCE
ncbi:MAG: hypothetical protein AB7I27_18730 [Bacteriovoracaceae bacterium]